jgi:hypothetical protein
MFLGLKWILMQYGARGQASYLDTLRPACRVGPAQQAEIV